MKAARLVVLGIAVAAGGLAAYLASGSNEPPPPPPAPAPVVQIETVDVLVAKNDIGMGTTLSEQDIQWLTWPASAAGPAYIKKSERPDAIAQYKGAIVRVPMMA